MSFFETINFFKQNGLDDLIPKFIFSYLIEKSIGIAIIIFFIWHIRNKIKLSKIKTSRENELYKNMNNYFKNKGK